MQAEARPVVYTEGVDIDERLQQLRDELGVYIRTLWGGGEEARRNYLRINREIRRLERIKRRQERPSLFQRITTRIMGVRSAPVMPVEEEEMQVARFME
jgi:hypothetical protein